MKIHFIGISGIGVSALAKYYLQKGEQVTGSDLNRSEVASNLERLGAKIFYGQQKADNVASDIDLVVYTVAVPKDNPELLQAGKLKIKTQTYPEALGDLVKKHFTIAVCGMSGKSTTTSMTGIVLKKAGLSPNVIVGTRVKEFENSNCLVGKSNYLVIEACEY
ncbi:MAG: UDP-N-acetylmuramate--L-alanine ligase, partial [Candidatus Nealsonbacteria bacterium CG_4_8_14_3_um_filter_39_7]